MPLPTPEKVGRVKQNSYELERVWNTINIVRATGKWAKHATTGPVKLSQLQNRCRLTSLCQQSNLCRLVSHARASNGSSEAGVRALLDAVTDANLINYETVVEVSRRLHTTHAIVKQKMRQAIHYGTAQQTLGTLRQGSLRQLRFPPLSNQS